MRLKYNDFNDSFSKIIKILHSLNYENLYNEVYFNGVFYIDVEHGTIKLYDMYNEKDLAKAVEELFAHDLITYEDEAYMFSLNRYKLKPELIETPSWDYIIEELTNLGFRNLRDESYLCTGTHFYSKYENYGITIDLKTGEVRVHDYYGKLAEETMKSLINKGIIILKDTEQQNKSDD